MALGLFRLASGVPASLRREASWRSGAYVTDGQRLFRVLAPLSGRGSQAVAILEDCVTDEQLCFTARELWHLWLRPVVPASA